MRTPESAYQREKSAIKRKTARTVVMKVVSAANIKTIQLVQLVLVQMRPNVSYGRQARSADAQVVFGTMLPTKSVR